MLTKLNEVNPSNLFDFGGKAEGLIWLSKNGYSVPEFYLISHLYVIDLLKKSEIFSPKDFEIKNEILFDLILNDLHSLAKQNSFFIEWKDLAIRSSDINEDGSQDSFAGIHQSILNVNGIINVAHAIRQVIESFYGTTALQYRSLRNLNAENIRPAIIIQKMVKPLFSGVAFTNHPLMTQRDSVWISATQGLGDQLVSGLVSGDEFVFESGELKKIKIHNGDFSESVLINLAEACLKISHQRQQPQDIEWAFDGKQIWYLQSRFITVHWEKYESKSIIFDNSNIQESYCGVTTPLTFSFASVCYQLVYSQLMKFMFMSEEEINNAQLNLKYMLGLVNGRIYYNINNWYAGLMYLPSFGKRKKEMEEMMGLEKSVDFVHDHVLSLNEKVKRVPRMIKLVIVMIIRFIRINDLVEEFDKWFWKLYNSAEIQNIYLLSECEVFEKIKYFQDKFLEKWAIPVLNDTKVMMDMGSVKRILQKYKYEEEFKALIAGAEIESTLPTIELHLLSKEFACNSDIEQILFNYRSFDVLRSLELFYPELYYKVISYINKYGDRSMGELKLETVTMRQEPEVLFNLIRQYIQSGLHLKSEIMKQNHQIDSQSLNMNKILIQMNYWDRFKIKFKIKSLKKSIAAREKMRFHRTRNFGLMRELYLALGEKWSKRQLLKSKRDIFYLTHQEIFDIGSGKITTLSINELITIRKRDFEYFKSLNTPGQVKLNFPPISPYIHNERNLAFDSHFTDNVSQLSLETQSHQFQSKNIWKGLPASQGEVVGEVIFVSELSEASNISGKILLAERTDPGWTPLFALVKGVIVEKGSLLSHSAIIAREMGIPSVIAIPSITSILKTGDQIRLDGSHGTIERISKEEILTSSNDECLR